ncbi:MAG: OsmC family protein [Halofilum sp. (in: g-proteobacteria)]
MSDVVEATSDAEAPGVSVCNADGALRSQIDAAGHDLVADEPEDAGGEGAGPAPHDYLLASLGACTAMTLRMYARHKGWDLRRVCVRVRRGEPSQREDDGARVEHLQRDIELEGDLDASQRARLVEIAERCPVHRTLTAEIEIATAAESV